MMPADALQALLSELLDAPDGALALLQVLLQRRDTQAAALTAHQLKGSCMMLGLRALRDQAATAEQRLRALGQGVLPEALALELAAQLRQHAAHTRSALRAAGVLASPGQPA